MHDSSLQTILGTTRGIQAVESRVDMVQSGRQRNLSGEEHVESFFSKYCHVKSGMYVQASCIDHLLYFFQHNRKNPSDYGGCHPTINVLYAKSLQRPSPTTTPATQLEL